VSNRWGRSHDYEHWKDRSLMVALFHSAAVVWSSLALCVICSLDAHLPTIAPKERPTSGLQGLAALAWQRLPCAPLRRRWWSVR